jgi:hypothetical protein
MRERHGALRGARNEEARKIARFSLRMKMRSRTATLLGNLLYSFFMARDLREDERVRRARKSGREGRERRSRNR